MALINPPDRTNANDLRSCGRLVTRAELKGVLAAVDASLDGTDVDELMVT